MLRFPPMLRLIRPLPRLRFNHLKTLQTRTTLTRTKSPLRPRELPVNSVSAVSVALLLMAFLPRPRSWSPTCLTI